MLVVIFMGGYVTYKLNQLNKITREIDSVDGATIRISEQLLEILISQVGFEKKYFIAGDMDFYEQFWQIKEYFLSNLETIRPLTVSPTERALIAVVENNYTRYLTLFKEEAGIRRQQQNGGDKTFSTQTAQITEEVNQSLNEIIRFSRVNRNQKIQKSSEISNQVLRVTAMSAVLVVIMGTMISFFNTRKINRSILLLQERTKEIAKGKFEKIHNISAPPEIKELADDFNLMCDRLRELDEMKVDFISHVSHELRTPLTAIREASSMLLEGTYKDKPKKQHELLSITKEECERLIGSVSRILDLSRMEGKMMKYHFSESSLTTIIEKMVTKLSPIAHRKHVTFELNMSSELPFVKIDAHWIDQVLENLIGNALKFTSSKDSITITADIHKESNKFIEVCILDTGSGMAKGNLDKIFDKFHRIESGKETVRGTGLGLPIAKHIVAAHGGKIWAESEDGKWSTFYFTLPVA
jgi:signal transduction histidine kinase